MRINLAKSAGFCFGVKRALDIAFKTAKPDAQVQMLGDIVHNEDVIATIKKMGIQKIGKLSSGKNKALLIRAHGASLATFTKARMLGYKIIDATCPMVKEIHKIAQEMERKGYRIIVVGDKKHDEVRGIIGQLKKSAIVIDDINNIPYARLKCIKRAALLAQSTQNLQNVLGIAEKLTRTIKYLRFFNTICGPTRKKQSEIRSLPLDNDVVVVIGSKTSANTKRLYEISKALNARTYWVRSKNDLQAAWFKNAESVGVTAGASTPEATTKDVIAAIRSI